MYPPHPTVQLRFAKGDLYKCQTLVVSQYGPASLFAGSLIGPIAPADRVNFSKAKQQGLADLFVSPSGETLHLVFNDSLPAMHEIFLSKFIEKYVQCERVIMLMSVARATLKDEKVGALSVLGSLCLVHFNECD